MRPGRVNPEKEALYFIASGEDKDSLQKAFINKKKGYGVFATKNIEPGEFLLEYVGRHITALEGEALFKKYSDEEAAFLFFYSFQGQTFCVDGSKDTARLGRFINDDHINPNCQIKIILDEKKSPHLCAFAVTKINAGEEVAYDCGDPKYPWRHETITSSNNEHLEKMESRWKGLFENLDSKLGVMEIDDLVYNTNKKIANGCNAAEIFPGLFRNCLVAVKRVARHISQRELEMAYFLCSGNLQAEHLLKPIAVFEDTYFAYFVSPLCEHSLIELIENKGSPGRQSLTDHRRLEICQDLLLALQELHSHGILHGDLKPENILFDINNKLYIADFGASRKLDLAKTTLLSHMAGSFSWSSYEDVGGVPCAYKKESDIQVAGCLLHYVLTDGQHPYQTRTPYSSDPVGLSQNIREGNFTLQCDERWTSQREIITRMLSKSCRDRPTIEECIQAVKCFTRLSEPTGTTNHFFLEKTNKDSLHTTKSCPDTLHETHMAETVASETGNDLMDSSSSTKEESSECEMCTEEQDSLSLKLSDDEVDEQSSFTEEEFEMTTEEHHSFSLNISDDEEEEQAEELAKKNTAPGMSDEYKQQTNTEEEAEKVSIQEEELPRKKKREELPKDQKAQHDIPQQQDAIKVKMSSNTAHQRVYDKKNYCLYCQKPFVKITRHLKQRHSNKAEVARALAHKQGSAMCNLLLSKVRNMGNYHHNCSVLSSGKGQIIPKRQAIHPATATDYLPCKFCFAMYMKTDLRRHHKRCELHGFKL